MSEIYVAFSRTKEQDQVLKTLFGLAMSTELAHDIF